MDLTYLQREAHAIAKDQGWYDTVVSYGEPLERSLYEQLERIHSALSKVGDEFQAIRPDGGAATNGEGVSLALADVVIRTADMAEFYGKNLERELARSRRRRRRIGSPQDQYVNIVRSQLTPGGWILGCHEILSKVYPMSARPGGLAKSLVQFLLILYAMAAHYDIDLDAAIATQMEYLRGRSYQHERKGVDGSH